jgi:hypothetical protein
MMSASASVPAEVEALGRVGKAARGERAKAQAEAEACASDRDPRGPSKGTSATTRTKVVLLLAPDQV